MVCTRSYTAGLSATRSRIRLPIEVRLASMSLYVHALRAARARQLGARALRPLNRRRFPAGEPPHAAAPIPAAAELWRSVAFEAASMPDRSTRLGRFHRQY